VVSAQRGQLVTDCRTIKATGNIPPAVVFPRAAMHDALMTNAPEESWSSKLPNNRLNDRYSNSKGVGAHEEKYSL
jgi:hypothetical protein